MLLGASFHLFAEAVDDVQLLFLLAVVLLELWGLLEDLLVQHVPQVGEISILQDLLNAGLLEGSSSFVAVVNGRPGLAIQLSAAAFTADRRLRAHSNTG